MELIILVLGDGCWVLSLYKTILLEVIILVLGDGCWVLSLYKTILLEEIIPCMWMNLIL